MKKLDEKAKMKVLHLLKTAIGASWALRQVTELVKLGVEVHLALPDGPMVEKYQQAGIHVHLFDPSLNITKPWRNFSCAMRLRALVKKVQPDIVHSHFVATTLLMRVAMLGLKIPKIFHVPGPLHLEHSFFRQLDLLSANKYDFWLASCVWTQQKYQQCGIASTRVGLAYYGVNEKDVSFDTSTANFNRYQLKQALAMADDDFLIGMVAYFYAPKRYLGQKRGLKGHEDLIDALVMVRKKYPKVKCVFVGGAWGNTEYYFEAVKQYALARAPENCVFLGNRNDVAKLYPQFDLAVHPSHSENVGGAVESMYANVATLTTDVGGFPDVVVDGETGFMVKSKDPQALAEKIIIAIENPQQRKQQISNALVKVKQVMNVQDSAKKVYDFYIDVLALANKRSA
jgi:glycosyltransferase involved in cell wall biosynthesis